MHLTHAGTASRSFMSTTVMRKTKRRGRSGVYIREGVLQVSEGHRWVVYQLWVVLTGVRGGARCNAKRPRPNLLIWRGWWRTIGYLPWKFYGSGFPSDFYDLPAAGEVQKPARMHVAEDCFRGASGRTVLRPASTEASCSSNCEPIELSAARRACLGEVCRIHRVSPAAQDCTF